MDVSTIATIRECTGENKLQGGGISLTLIVLNQLCMTYILFDC
jgi:hypothetical protein